MSRLPVTSIDLKRFAADPYADLARMRRAAPVTYVPELHAVLLTRRDDIHYWEKRTDIFSSDQPGGLMTVLMGQNLMRRDGDAHMVERKILCPSLSPRTVRDHWLPRFDAACREVLAALKPRGACDLVTDFAMPVAARALKAITGLETMTDAEMDGSSQAMIDGCANYAGDPEIEARCHAGTALIDAHIDRQSKALPDSSALAVQLAAGLPMENTRANIKLIISGGQNEPRDAIAGTAWALLSHRAHLDAIRAGHGTWEAAFAEYARWQSPIGMSPRRIAQDFEINGAAVAADTRAFLMFSSACHDEDYFIAPERFDPTRNTGPSIPFGAGPHFCAGAAASRALIVQVALPRLFEALPDLALESPVTCTGWAFRGPVSVPVRWGA